MKKGVKGQGPHLKRKGRKKKRGRTRSEGQAIQAAAACPAARGWDRLVEVRWGCPELAPRAHGPSEVTALPVQPLWSLVVLSERQFR